MANVYWPDFAKFAARTVEKAIFLLFRKLEGYPSPRLAVHGTYRPPKKAMAYVYGLSKTSFAFRYR